MKKALSILLVLTLLVGCVFTLASCSKMLSGEYELDAVLAGKTYKFSGNKVTITYEVLGFEKSIEGTYAIAAGEDGKQTITFTFAAGTEDAEDYAGEFSFAEGKEGDESYIKIGGVKYVKK